MSHRAERKTEHSDSRPATNRRRFLASSAGIGAAGLAGCMFGSGGGDTTQLTFWHQESVEHRVSVFDEFINRFNDEHDDIEVQQQAQSWDEVFGKLTSALESDSEPDFMFSLPAFTMTFQARDALVDVSDIVEDINSEHDAYDNTITPYKYDGGTWGIPMWDMVFLHHHRSDTLGKLGGWPPANWEEWLTLLEEGTDAGNDTYGICLPANKNLWTTENLYTLMINRDSYVYGPDGKIMFDTPETVKVLDFYKNLFNAASPEAATNWGWAEWERSLLQGQAHSTNGFSSWVRGLQDTDFDQSFEAIKQPGPTDGNPGSIHYVNNLMVFNEEKKESIGTWAKWMHSQDVYGEWLANLEPTLYLPLTKTGENSDGYWNHDLISKYEPMVKTQFEALPESSIYGFREIHVENDLYLPSLGTLEGSHVLAEIVQELIVNDKSPEETASWGQNRLQNVLEVEGSDQL